MVCHGTPISCMVMSWHGCNIQITGSSCGGSTGHRWIPSQKVSKLNWIFDVPFRLTELLNALSNCHWFHTPCDVIVMSISHGFSHSPGMLGSCVGLMVLAAFYEGLKVAREILLRKATQKTNYTVSSATHGSANILVQEKVHKPT